MLADDPVTAKETASDKRSLLWIVPLLLLITLLVFWPVNRAGFVSWDDNIHIYENPNFNPLTSGHLLRLWQQPYQGLYIPVSYTVYALLAGVSRLPPTPAAAGDASLLFNPHPFHLANLLLHCLNVLLVFALLRRLVKNNIAAAGGALLFALHPVQVESVAWISEMRGTLCGAFSLLALWQYLHSVSDDVSPGQRRGHLALASAAFALALLCKPAAVAVPLMAWILERCAMRPAKITFPLPLLLWALAAGAVVLLTRSVQSVPPNVAPTLWARPLIAGDALAFYLVKLAAPLNLGPDYGRTPAFVLGHAWGYAAWLLPAGIAFLLWRFRARFPWLPMAGRLFAAWLLPVLGLIPFGFQWYSTTADRYLYLALLGPALALSFVLSRTHSKAVWGGCVAVLCLFAWQSAAQVRFWNNSTTLFRHTLAVNPNSWTALDRLGEDQDSRGNTAGAIAYYRQSLALRPDFGYARINLGKSLTDQGKLPEAIVHLTAAVQILPDVPEAHYNLGKALYLTGQTGEAIAQYQEALRLQPANPLSWNNLGLALLKQQRTDEAEGCFRHALAINPGFRDSEYNLGNALTAQGSLDAAAECYRRVLAVDPDNADAHFNLGAVLCQQRKMADAIPELSAALRARPNDAPAHYYLGVALATLGRLPEALAQLHETLRLDPGFADAKRVIALIQLHQRH